MKDPEQIPFEIHTSTGNGQKAIYFMSKKPSVNDDETVGEIAFNY